MEYDEISHLEERNNIKEYLSNFQDLKFSIKDYKNSMEIFIPFKGFDKEITYSDKDVQDFRKAKLIKYLSNKFNGHISLKANKGVVVRFKFL